jgi:hypothetical protein
MNAARFPNKDAAAAVAARFPLAGAVFISPVTAAVEGVKSGWYVGFPRNASSRFVTEIEAAEING